MLAIKNIKSKLQKYFRSQCKSLFFHNKFNTLFNPNQIISCWEHDMFLCKIVDKYGQYWTGLDNFGQEYWFRIQELHLLCKRTAIYKQTQLYNVWLNSPIAIETNKSPKDGLEVLFKKWYRFLQVWRFRRILLSFSLFWRVVVKNFVKSPELWHRS